MMVDLNWEVCKLFASSPSRIPTLEMLLEMLVVLGLKLMIATMSTIL